MNGLKALWCQIFIIPKNCFGTTFVDPSYGLNKGVHERVWTDSGPGLPLKTYLRPKISKVRPPVLAILFYLPLPTLFLS